MKEYIIEDDTSGLAVKLSILLHTLAFVAPLFIIALSAGVNTAICKKTHFMHCIALSPTTLILNSVLYLAVCALTLGLGMYLKNHALFTYRALSRLANSMAIAAAITLVIEITCVTLTSKWLAGSELATISSFWKLFGARLLMESWGLVPLLVMLVIALRLASYFRKA